ncbi:GNAT family N-acetyltransferase [Paenibacillus puldeungensis]|uniref:GNAT family N-acetyltransferase n=1 Tax=Paenibacillus puldeungensis TaxID=696536 RepID=A0ABW3RRI8_9BACL
MDSIHTERLTIRRFTPDDWQDLHEYLSDEEVVRFEPYEPYSEQQAKEEAIHRSKDAAFYAVCLKQSGKLIGNLYLSKGDFDTYELGYVFNSKYQGQGYASESSKALLDYAFTQLGARRVIAMCSTLNEHSWRLLERLGLRREGLLLQNVFFKTDSHGDPIWFDTYEYAILKKEWGM